MNNEPVVWMDGEGGFYHNDDYEVCKEHNIADDLTPLYTHPAELTDEEIYKIANEIEAIQPQHGLRLSNDLNVMDFARAILRKASEK